DERAGARDHRRAQPSAVVDEAIVEPSPVAHPGVVDGVVAPREQPPDTVAVLADHDVAAVGAAGAYAGGFLEEPDADPVMEVLALERADRADVGGADRVVIVESAVVDVEHGAVAEIEDRKLAGLADFAAEAHASAAQNAAFLVEEHPLADVDALFVLAPRFQRARKPASEAHRVVLQPALAGLVADRAVQRMVEQEHLKYAAARQRNFGVFGLHDHPVAHLGVARDL